PRCRCLTCPAYSDDALAALELVDEIQEQLSLVAQAQRCVHPPAAQHVGSGHSVLRLPPDNGPHLVLGERPSINLVLPRADGGELDCTGTLLIDRDGFSVVD